jgi:hypothetical protein
MRTGGRCGPHLGKKHVMAYLVCHAYGFARKETPGRRQRCDLHELCPAIPICFFVNNSRVEPNADRSQAITLGILLASPFVFDGRVLCFDEPGSLHRPVQQQR